MLGVAYDINRETLDTGDYGEVAAHKSAALRAVPALVRQSSASGSPSSCGNAGKETASEGVERDWSCSPAVDVARAGGDHSVVAVHQRSH